MIKRNTRRTLSIVVALCSAFMLQACSSNGPAESSGRPNILLIVADDLGYTDIGAYGGEIDTPNLDALASEGVQFTRFYSSASCTPARAMLLTGMSNHYVGLGANTGVPKRVPILQGRPAYVGELREDIPTLASRLQNHGYATMFAGKWHLGKSPASFPPARGFERSFYLEHGGGSHFADARGNLSRAPHAAYWEGEQRVTELPEDFYSSTFYVDKTLEYLQARDPGAPFFAQISFTAPHWPLQAPDNWIDRYAGQYGVGWEEVRASRLESLTRLGLFEEGLEPAQFPGALGSWDELTDEERLFEARRMEIYAAMIAHMDNEIGRLIQHLKDTGEYDNTIIVFLSDNGAEGNDISNLNDNATWIPENFDQSFENMGRLGSYVWAGRGWGHVSSGPSRLYKTFVSEGGIRVPAIVKFARGRDFRGVYRQAASITDIAPTLLEAAGLEPSAPAMQGVSILSVLNSREDAERDHPIALELYGGRAIIEGRWKALLLWPPEGTGNWALYDLTADPAESRDLAKEHPEVLERLVTAWEAYAETNGVYGLDRDIGYGRYPDQNVSR